MSSPVAMPGVMQDIILNLLPGTAILVRFTFDHAIPCQTVHIHSGREVYLDIWQASQSIRTRCA